MASKTRTATAAIAIAGMLWLPAIATAASRNGPQWPSFHQPAWPNLPGEPGYDPAKVTPAPVPPPAQEITTGSANANVYKAGPVATRWGEFRRPPAFFGEFGLRFVYSSNKTAKNLYDYPGGMMVSRLTYGDMNGYGGEGFGRVEHTSGFYFKGYAGGAALSGGKLQDEDFPPLTQPYSSTDSRQNNGTLGYASIDLGYAFIRQPGLRMGAYVGYHYLDNTVDAFGCGQTAKNGFICGVPIPDTVRVISQNNHWNSLRLGLDAKIALGGPFSLSLDAAWLPYVKLNGADSHLLRIGTNPGDFTGPVPEDGTGTGYQLEASIAYAYSPNVSFGIGARYWRMETSGNTHFEGHVVGVNAFPQPVEWKIESLGVFAQASFKFGPYPTGGF